MSFRKIWIIGGALVGLMLLTSVAGNLVETNDAGNYQVKQAAMSGALSVRNEPGTYWQGFATITTYPQSDEYSFTKGDSTDGPIAVRFNDGGNALISGAIKVRLSGREEDLLRLHNDYKSFEAVKHSLIRSVVTEAVQQTANLMKAEESYSTRRSEFAALAEEQVALGIFETVANVQKLKDADGNEFVENSVNLKMVNGKPVIRKHSSLPRYKVEILQFVIKDIDFDDTIEKLISKKKEAEQMKVVARANAEKAKQDAITAREQGEAQVAVAKAAEEVKKIQAVVEAQKEFEVSVLARKRADEEAKATLIRKQADAEANRLLVKAGLTPLERANIEKETAIGVAKAFSEMQLPSVVVSGGTGHGTDIMQAMGLNQLMELSNKMGRTKRTPAKSED